jgi:hypothetical protein
MDPFDDLAKSLDVRPVTKPAHPTKPQRMNANAFCIRNRVFAMRVGGDLVLKLSPKRVAELIDGGTGMPNLVGGRAMKEWVNLSPASQGAWRSLALESLEYVRDKH